jgi:hypothetical protein
MRPQDLIGRKVTITEIDLEAPTSFDVAHITFEVDDGSVLVLEAELHQARAKAVLMLRGEAISGE